MPKGKAAKNIPISLLMPQELRQELKVLAKAKGMNMSTLIRSTMIELVDREKAKTR